MESLVKNYFWVLKGLGLAIAMWLAASATMTSLGSRAFAVDPGDVTGAALGDGKRGRSSTLARTQNRSGKSKTFEAITARNIFCPTCVPVETVAADGTPTPSGSRTSLNLKLMATMEAAEAEASFATIRDEDSGAAGLFGIGDAIRQGVTLASVEIGRVYLNNNGRLEYLGLDDETPRPRSRSNDDDDDKRRRRRRRRSRLPEGAEDAINCPNENLCIVEREFVEKMLANPATLARQARVIPSKKNGETQGYKFYGIRRNSLPRMLGLKNGDLLTEINGESLGGDLSKVMTLLTKLRRASNLSVTLERRGKTIQKEVRIQ